MFFEAALEGKNQWWRYLVMVLAAFGAAMSIGNIPILLAVVIAGIRNPERLELATENPADFGTFGLSSNLALILVVAAFIVGLIAFILLIKPLNGRSFNSVINGSNKVRWGRIFSSFFIWGLLFAVYLILSIKADPDNFIKINSGSGLIVLALVALIFLPFQTTFEEVIFRGYLMQGFGLATRNKWAPLLITSLLFGLMHGINPEIKEYGFFVMMPQYILIGLLYGIISVLDDGIELAIGAHAANNIFLSIFVTQKSSALQTDAMFEQQEVLPWTDFAVLSILSLVFFLILFVLYKWNFKKARSIKF